MSGEANFFETPETFRAWLRKNHAKATECIVGFFKSHTGAASVTWPESVAEALCYGWIDGVRRRLDDGRYTIRFTPRRAGSKWSAVNVKLMATLEAEGRMMPAGRAAFEARRHKEGPEAAGYSAQKKDGTLDAARLRAFKGHKDAWEFFESQPPGYRRAAAWWVMSAKREETRDSRMEKLVEMSRAGKRLG